MIRLSICIKKVFFRVFMCVLWFVPVFIFLSLDPLYPMHVKAVEAAELSENQGQSQPALKDLQINVHDVFGKHPLPQLLVIDDDGAESLLWKSQIKYDFSPKFKLEIDIFQKKSSEFENPFFSSNLISSEPDKQLEIFRLKQKSNSFYYGIEYRYVDKDLKNPKDYKKKTKSKTNVGLENDQQGVEIWGAKEIGPIRLKTFFSRFWDNVNQDPKNTQMLTNEYGLKLKYKLRSLPIYFSLSHSREQSESTIEPDGSEPQGSQKETYSGSLYYYGGKAFDMTVSSSYSPQKDLFHPGKETKVFWHEINASIQPVRNIIITPTMGFNEYRYLWYGGSTENPSASLSITYSNLFDAVDLSLWGGYSRTWGTDGYQDGATYDASVNISWDAKYFFFPKMRYSFDFGYDKYEDKIYPDSSYNALYTSFELEFQHQLALLFPH